jgi:hypothetical protein
MPLIYIIKPSRARPLKVLMGYDGKVEAAEPELKYLIGYTRLDLLEEVTNKGWELSE